MPVNRRRQAPTATGFARQNRRSVAKVFWVAILVVGLSGCGDGADRPDPMALMEGETIYKVECATCHGAKLEGQADWRTRRPDGKLPAPPHDATGHTWHHPREQLAKIVKLGMVPPNAPQGYASDMPAFAGKLTDRQIQHVLLFIESKWPPEILARRVEKLQK